MEDEGFVPPAVSVSAIEVSVWNLTAFFVKAIFAFFLALIPFTVLFAIVAALLGAAGVGT